MSRPRTYPFDALRPGESLALPWPGPLPWSRETRRYRRRALAALRQEQRLYHKRFDRQDRLYGLLVRRVA
jgi:hypothetical protein